MRSYVNTDSLPNNLLGGNFLMSLPTWMDLKKVSSDRLKSGGSEEIFSILYQSSGSAESFRRSLGTVAIAPHIR